MRELALAVLLAFLIVGVAGAVAVVGAMTIHWAVLTYPDLADPIAAAAVGLVVLAGGALVGWILHRTPQ